jgi:hypothetical protein
MRKKIRDVGPAVHPPTTYQRPTNTLLHTTMNRHTTSSRTTHYTYTLLRRKASRQWKIWWIPLDTETLGSLTAVGVLLAWGYPRSLLVLFSSGSPIQLLYPSLRRCATLDFFFSAAASAADWSYVTRIDAAGTDGIPYHVGLFVLGSRRITLAVASLHFSVFFLASRYLWDKCEHHVTIPSSCPTFYSHRVVFSSCNCYAPLQVQELPRSYKNRGTVKARFTCQCLIRRQSREAFR